MICTLTPKQNVTRLIILTSKDPMTRESSDAETSFSNKESNMCGRVHIKRTEQPVVRRNTSYWKIHVLASSSLPWEQRLLRFLFPLFASLLHTFWLDFHNLVKITDYRGKLSLLIKYIRFGLIFITLTITLSFPSLPPFFVCLWAASTVVKKKGEKNLVLRLKVTENLITTRRSITLPCLNEGYLHTWIQYLALLKRVIDYIAGWRELKPSAPPCPALPRLAQPYSVPPPPLSLPS